MSAWIKPEDIAAKVAHSTKAHESGVVVTVSRSWGDARFVIWAIAPGGRIGSHSLDAHLTDEARLTAHVEGFVENHIRAWKGVAA